MAHKPGVLNSNGRPVQESGQHDGENELQVLVLSQRGAYLVCLKKLFQVCYCICIDLRVPILFDLFTTQTRERVIRVADDVGSSTNSSIELVVSRGQVYFESEESLSKFMSNTVSISLHARTNSCINCACMHCYRRAIEAVTKPVNARTVVCSWSIPMLKLCSHLQQSWANTWTSSAQQIEVHVVDRNHDHIFLPYSLHQEFYYKTLTYKLSSLELTIVYLKAHCLCEHPKAHLFVSVMNIQYMYLCHLWITKQRNFVLTTNSIYLTCSKLMYYYNHTISSVSIYCSMICAIACDDDGRGEEGSNVWIIKSSLLDDFCSPTWSSAWTIKLMLTQMYDSRWFVSLYNCFYLEWPKKPLFDISAILVVAWTEYVHCMKGTENSGIRQVCENNKIQTHVTNSSIHIFCCIDNFHASQSVHKLDLHNLLVLSDSTTITITIDRCKTITIWIVSR